MPETTPAYIERYCPTVQRLINDGGITHGEIDDLEKRLQWLNIIAFLNSFEKFLIKAKYSNRESTAFKLIKQKIIQPEDLLDKYYANLINKLITQGKYLSIKKLLLEHKVDILALRVIENELELVVSRAKNDPDYKSNPLETTLRSLAFISSFYNKVREKGCYSDDFRSLLTKADEIGPEAALQYYDKYRSVQGNFRQLNCDDFIEHRALILQLTNAKCNVAIALINDGKLSFDCIKAVEKFNPEALQSFNTCLIDYVAHDYNHLPQQSKLHKSIPLHALTELFLTGTLTPEEGIGNPSVMECLQSKTDWLVIRDMLVKNEVTFADVVKNEKEISQILTANPRQEKDFYRKQICQAVSKIENQNLSGSFHTPGRSK